MLDDLGLPSVPFGMKLPWPGFRLKKPPKIQGESAPSAGYGTPARAEKAGREGETTETQTCQGVHVRKEECIFVFLVGNRTDSTLIFPDLIS